MIIQAIRAISFAPPDCLHAGTLAVGTNQSFLAFFEYSDGQWAECCRLEECHQGSVFCVGWSNKGKMIATGSNDQVRALLKLRDKKCYENNGVVGVVR